MESKHIVRPLALLSALMSLLFAPSPAASNNSPVGAGTVCASGTCCPEANSYCNAGGPTHPNYYYATTGACGS